MWPGSRITAAASALPCCLLGCCVCVCVRCLRLLSGLVACMLACLPACYIYLSMSRANGGSSSLANQQGAKRDTASPGTCAALTSQYSPPPAALAALLLLLCCCCCATRHVHNSSTSSTRFILAGLLRTRTAHVVVIHTCIHTCMGCFVFMEASRDSRQQQGALCRLIVCAVGTHGQKSSSLI